MKPEEEQKLKEKYTHWYMFDDTPAEKVGWSSDYDQTSRFTQFLLLEKLAGKPFSQSSVLDVGCGDGALFFFLQENNSRPAEFVGIDMNEKYIERASELYTKPTPDMAQANAEFILGNFLDHRFDTQFDYVVASGIFNVNVYSKQKRAYEVLYETVQKMLTLAKVGIGFNFLSGMGDGSFVLTPDMTVYDKNEILKWCSKLNMKKIELIEGYDPMDSTILIVK